ncbi:MAG: alpha-hydroxy-acid oxidizing protein [Opitutaceae bacterium]
MNSPRSSAAAPLPSKGFGVEHQMKIYWDGLAHGAPALPISLDALRELARRALPADAFAYIGAAGAEKTLAANLTDFDRWQLVPRMLTNIATRSLATTIHGQPSTAPLIVAPIGLHELYHPEGELPSARAAAARRIPFTLSVQSSRTIEDVSLAMGDAPRFFQLYWSRDRELTRSFIHRAEAAGYSALVVTLDTRLLGWRPRDLDLGHNPFLHGKGLANYFSDPVFRAALARPPEEDHTAAVKHFLGVFNDPTLVWEDLAWLRAQTKLPITLKGILHPDDARRAVDCGVDGLIVSNHGGRQVDGSISAIGALPAIASAIGKKITVGLDSGVRTGADALKALALGADYVGLGRPCVYGLAAAGESGVGWVLDNFLAEFDLTLALSGLTSPAQLAPDFLRAVA